MTARFLRAARLKKRGTGRLFIKQPSLANKEPCSSRQGVPSTRPNYIRVGLGGPEEESGKGRAEARTERAPTLLHASLPPPRGMDGWACWAVAAFSIKPTQRTEHQTRTAPPCCHQQPAPQRNPSHAGIPRAPMADSHPLPCMTPRGMRWWAFPPAPSGDNPTTTMAATPSSSSRGFLAPKPASQHPVAFFPTRAGCAAAAHRTESALSLQ